MYKQGKRGNILYSAVGGGGHFIMAIIILTPPPCPTLLHLLNIKHSYCVKDKHAILTS